jgi:single-stranded-DNA-specific exonuclease
VSRSPSSSRLPRQRWQIAPAQEEKALQLAQVSQLPSLLTQVLINRGINTPEAVCLFLEPELQLLPSPLEEFPDLPIALELLLRAIATRQFIAICGDYDADGMTSTALLLRALRLMGAIVDYAIPSRMQEGYGLNQRIVEEFHQEGVGVILTVDNGIAAYDPIARARELGLTVIVTDHHDIPPTLPPANAILNPKLIREGSPYRGVAGVGVAYILAICLAQCLQKTQDLTTPLIELFTLGTIADLAPLTGVNRRWVKRGLKLLPQSKIPGIQALIQVAGLSNEKALKPEAIGFRLGPRINAIGRISDPQIVIELLTTEEDGQALELAMKCEQINQLRQRLCELIEQEAIAWCEQTQFAQQQEHVLVIVQPNWHHGVIGIVASRLVERYGVPVFIGTYEEETNVGETVGEDGEPGSFESSEAQNSSTTANSGAKIRGSARGIPEFDVFEALQFCADLLEKFGGHRAAGGFSFKSENLDELRSRLSRYAKSQLQPDCLKPLIAVDAQADFSELTLALYEQIDALHPCGIENPDPVFWTPNIRVVEQRAIGRDQTHLKLTLAQEDQPSVGIRAIAWRWAEYYPLPSSIDIAYRLRLNEWNGNKAVELELVGVRPATGADTPLTLSPKARSRTAVGSALVNPFPGGSTSSISIPSGATSPMTHSLLAAEIGKSVAVAQTDLPLFADESTEVNFDFTDLQTPLSRIEFYYSKRKYMCSVLQVGTVKELRIRNPEGQVLAIQPQQRRGLLGNRRQETKEIDVSQPHYFNLLRAALNALEIAEKNQLLWVKDQLIVEKDQQIATLNQQLDLLHQELSQVSQERQQQLQVLQTAIEEREATIQAHETHLSQLPQRTDAAQLKPEDIKRDLKTQIGETGWYCLSQQSQKDLVAAYKNLYTIQSEAFTAQIVDYSEVGLRLGFVAEREVIQPFFKQIHQFLQANGEANEIGGVPLRVRKKYTLEMLPPLLVPEWQSLQTEALNSSSLLPEAELYTPVSSHLIRQTDRQTVKSFLQQWEHPLAQWLLQQAIEAASTIDQINKLRTVAAQSESLLHQWQFELLHGLVIGNEAQQGILQKIYVSKG